MLLLMHRPEWLHFPIPDKRTVLALHIPGRRRVLTGFLVISLGVSRLIALGIIVPGSARDGSRR